MEGKKKYLVLLLLLLLGFGVVSFAGEDDTLTGENKNDTKKNYEKAEEKVEEVENNPTEENINAALDIIEDVEDQTQREQLVDRVEDTRPGIDPALQITTVENMIANALSKKDIEEANKYFEDNNVADSTNDLEDGNLKDNLNDRIEKIEQILGDKTAPQIEGIEDGTTTKEDVTITVNDDTEVTIEVTLNGETIEFTTPFEQEGEYIVTATDQAHNTDSITFTIDKQQATMNYSTLRVDGNPVINKDGNNYYYLTNGDILEFAIAFNEELKQVPTVNINGKVAPLTLKLNPNPTYRDDKRIYLYEGKMELKDELNIENGILNITLTNVFDLAGNETTDEKTLNQTPTSNHRIAVYDSVLPVPTNVSIISRGEGTSDKYVKNNEIVRFIVDFDEEITIPENYNDGTFAVKINGQVVKFMKRTQVSGYSYIVDYRIPKNETTLTEGEITFEITGYTDFAGNAGAIITKATNKKYDKVFYDRTPVTINGIDKDTYTYDKVGVTPTTTDTDVKLVELTKNGEVVENYELGTPIVNAGEYELVVKDKAHNVTTKQFTIEKQQIEFEIIIDSEIELDNKEKTATIKVLNVENEDDYEIETENYYIMKADGTYYGPRKEKSAKEFGQYKVKVVIKSKNENYSDSETKYKTFKIVDTTAPTLEVTRNEEKNITYIRGKDLSRLIYTITKDGKEVHTVDSATCGCGNYFSITWLAAKNGDGDYTVLVTDEGGNTDSVTVNIDTTKPEVTDIKKGLVSNETVKVTLTFSEEIKELEGWTKVTNTEYTKTYNKEAKNEVITFKDLVSLVNTYEFTVDAKSPVVTPNHVELTLEEDKEEYTEPTFTVEEFSTYNKELLSGEVNTHKVGKYTLVYRFTDVVGNYTDVEVIVNVADTTLPTVTGVEDGAYYNTKTTHAIPVVSDKNLVSVKLVKHSKLLGDIDVTLLLFKNGKEIIENGSYTLTVKDKYNDPVVINFTVDSINPKVILLDKVETIRGDILPIIPQIFEENLKEIKVWKNGQLVEGYKLGDQLTETANYKIYVSDLADNEEEVEFKIDNEAPQIIMPTGYYTTYPIIVKDETNNIADTIVLKRKESNKFFPEYERYEVENNLLTEEGEYIIIVYDEAYNVTLTLIAIDKGIPTSNIIDGKSYYEVTPKAEDRNLLSVELYKDNGGLFPDKVEDYEHGDKVDTEGEYILKATDKTLVNTLVVKFTIDRTAPYEINTDNVTKLTSALLGKAPLDVTAKAKDAVDGEFDIQPTKIYHKELDKELDKVYTTPEYVGTYTVTYVATDKAGNKTEEHSIEIVIEKAKYGINYSGKTVEYNGESFDYKTATIIREDGEVVDGEITYKITKNDKVVTEIKDAGDYTIIVSSNSYEDIKDVQVTFKVEKAVLQVEFTEVVDGDTTSSIKNRLKFKTANGYIDNIDSTVILFGKSKYITTPVDKTRSKLYKTYFYVVTTFNDNYYIEGNVIVIEGVYNYEGAVKSNNYDI